MASKWTMRKKLFEILRDASKYNFEKFGKKQEGIRMHLKESGNNCKNLEEFERIQKETINFERILQTTEEFENKCKKFAIIFMQLNECECNWMNLGEFARIRKNFDDCGKCRNKNSKNLKEFKIIRNVARMKDNRYSTTNTLLLLLLYPLPSVDIISSWCWKCKKNGIETFGLFLKCDGTWFENACHTMWREQCNVLELISCVPWHVSGMISDARWW